MSAIRHKARTMARVRELHEAGWKPAEIQRRLRDEGHDVPARNTIWSWLNPEKAAGIDERRNRRYRAQRVGTATFRASGVRSPEWKLARMVALHDLGLSCNALAKLMQFDFGDSITEAQVRWALKLGRYPKTSKRSARGAGDTRAPGHTEQTA